MRGKVMTFSFGRYGEFGMTFTRVEPVARNQVIIPDDDLAAIERHAIGMPVPDDRGEIFGDTVVASAILDRLMHNALVSNTKGDPGGYANTTRSPQPHPPHHTEGELTSPTGTTPDHGTATFATSGTRISFIDIRGT